MFIRAELHCIFCGHDMGEVSLKALTRRPTTQELHAAYIATGRSEQPLWDREAERPLCPRCHGQLALELEVIRRPAAFIPRQGHARH